MVPRSSTSRAFTLACRLAEGATVSRCCCMSMVPSTCPSTSRSSRLRICPFTSTFLPMPLRCDSIAEEGDILAPDSFVVLGSQPSARQALRCIHHKLRAVEFEQRAFVQADGARILANVAGGVDASGQCGEVAVLDGLQGRDLDLGIARDFFERNSLIVAKVGDAPGVGAHDRHRGHL